MQVPCRTTSCLTWTGRQVDTSGRCAPPTYTKTLSRCLQATKLSSAKGCAFESPPVLRQCGAPSGTLNAVLHVGISCTPRVLHYCVSGAHTNLQSKSLGCVQGINASGGQQQRIQIARAVYAHPDVVLLDDPLSALDSKVGRAVFRTCIKEELAHTTRILVTNQLQYLAEADHVLVLKDGEVAESGHYKTLMSQNGALTAMMQDVSVDDAEGQEGAPGCATTRRHAFLMEAQPQWSSRTCLRLRPATHVRHSHFCHAQHIHHQTV